MKKVESLGTIKTPILKDVNDIQDVIELCVMSISVDFNMLTDEVQQSLIEVYGNEIDYSEEIIDIAVTESMFTNNRTIQISLCGSSKIGLIYQATNNEIDP